MEYARPDDGDCLRLGAGWHSGAAGAVKREDARYRQAVAREYLAPLRA
jgi:hypothetical protein